MPKFSNSSQAKLATCNPELQMIFNYVIRYFDCTIICGYRDKEAQDKAFNDGFSKVKFPNSKHNQHPSNAVDVVPYPIEWENVDRMRYFIGFVKGVAKMLLKYGQIDHELKTGIDWDNDFVLKDQRWNDFPHFELIL